MYQIFERSDTFYRIKIDLNGCYTYANRLFIRRFGQDGTPLLGKLFHESIHPEDTDRCMQAAIRCIENPQHQEKIWVRKPDRSGGYFWTVWEFAGEFDTQQQPIGVECIGVDMSPLAQLEAELRQQQDLLQQVLQSIPDSFFALDPQFNILFANPNFARFAGLKSPLLEGLNFWEAFPFLIPSELYNRLHLALERQTADSFDFFLPQHFRWFNTHITPTQNGTNVYMRDISQFVYQQQSLSEVNHLLNAIFNSSSDLIVYFDEKKRASYANVVAHRLLGEDIDLHKWVKVHKKNYTASDFLQQFDRVFKGEVIVQEEEITVQNQERWFQVEYHPVWNHKDQSIGILLTAIDIDPFKQSTFQILEQNRQLAEIARIQSHEVRKPLASIMGIVQLMKNMEEVADIIDELVAQLNTASSELDWVIRKIVEAANAFEDQAPEQ